jgi:hypothetical protein
MPRRSTRVWSSPSSIAAIDSAHLPKYRLASRVTLLAGSVLLWLVYDLPAEPPRLPFLIVLFHHERSLPPDPQHRARRPARLPPSV